MPRRYRWSRKGLFWFECWRCRGVFESTTYAVRHFQDFAGDRCFLCPHCVSGVDEARAHEGRRPVGNFGLGGEPVFIRLDAESGEVVLV